MISYRIVLKNLLRLSVFSILLITLLLGSFSPVQAAAPTGGTYGCDTAYIVQWGDTLYKIGLRFGISWPVIAANNGIGYPYWVYAGQYLCISGPAYGYPGYYPGYDYDTWLGVTVTDNKPDKNVSIRTSWLPKYDVLDVLIGSCHDSALNGKWVGRISTDGNEGVFSGKYKIPSAYYGYGCLAVRVTSLVTGRSGYDTFTNLPGSSISAALDFSVSSVVRNKTVTITISNARKGNKYKIYIGREGRGAYGGTYVSTFIPDSNQPATITLKIPEKFKGLTRLDLRILGIDTGDEIYHTFRNTTH